MNDERSESELEDQLTGLAAPLAQLSVGAVQDLAAVVRSTRRAGRDVWRLVNVVGRVRQVDWSGADAPGPAVEAPAVEAPSLEALPVDTLPVDARPVETPDPPAAIVSKERPAPNLFGPFGRVADAALKPATAIAGGVASPVRRMVADTMGLQLKDAGGDRQEDLREVSARLIQQSLELNAAFVQRHPAFAQILTELTPDEARILRFLAVAGAQPSIDIRTKSPFQIGSERIAHGINMIAEMAGCSWTEFSENYLANLNRLGLIVFSREPVEDYRRYSLLEVQPAAVEAIEHANLPTISIYRSVYLSAFGRQFCDVCIDTEGYDAGGWAVNERGDRILGARKRRA